MKWTLKHTAPGLYRIYDGDGNFVVMASSWETVNPEIIPKKTAQLIVDAVNFYLEHKGQDNGQD